MSQFQVPKTLEDVKAFFQTVEMFIPEENRELLSGVLEKLEKQEKISPEEQQELFYLFGKLTGKK